MRWTEGRNLEEVLRLMAAGALRPSRLTTHTFDLDDGPAAYRALLEATSPRSASCCAIPAARTPARARVGSRRSAACAPSRAGAPPGRAWASIGAGTFARGVLLPQLARRADIVAVATATGLSARASAERFGAALATTDADELIADEPSTPS